MIPRGTGYYQCIHGVVTVVDTLFAEPFLQIEGNLCSKKTFSVFVYPLSKEGGIG
jgi:hypothetical protein